MSTVHSTLIHRKEQGKMNPVVIIGAVLGTALGLVAAWLVYRTLNGQTVPMVSGMRQAFIALAIIGFLMCVTALPVRATTGAPWWRWSSPFTIAAIVVGASALLFVVLTLIGVKLPLIASDRQAMIALSTLLLAKWEIATVHLFVR